MRQPKRTFIKSYLLHPKKFSYHIKINKNRINDTRTLTRINFTLDDPVIIDLALNTKDFNDYLILI